MMVDQKKMTCMCPTNSILILITPGRSHIVFGGRCFLVSPLLSVLLSLSPPPLCCFSPPASTAHTHTRSLSLFLSLSLSLSFYLSLSFSLYLSISLSLSLSVYISLSFYLYISFSLCLSVSLSLARSLSLSQFNSIQFNSNELYWHDCVTYHNVAKALIYIQYIQQQHR